MSDRRRDDAAARGGHVNRRVHRQTSGIRAIFLHGQEIRRANATGGARGREHLRSLVAGCVAGVFGFDCAGIDDLQRPRSNVIDLSTVEDVPERRAGPRDRSRADCSRHLLCELNGAAPHFRVEEIWRGSIVTTRSERNRSDHEKQTSHFEASLRRSRTRLAQQASVDCQ